MRILKIVAALLLLAIPVLVQAEFRGIPGDSAWYFHADFAAMQKGEAGKGLYRWLDSEVFAELRQETGIDLGKEAQSLTAFSADNDGVVIVLDGSISQDSKDKLMAILAAATEGGLDIRKASGKDYFYFEGDGEFETNGDINVHIDDLEKEGYVSLAVRNKIIVTSREDQMKTLLASNGKIPEARASKNTLLMLSADRALMLAGANTEAFNGDGDWDSNIVRNTKQVAMRLADLGDELGFEATLVTTDADNANALGSIVRGLIALVEFSEDVDPEVATVLRKTKVDVKGATLNVALALDPATVVSALEN